MCIERCNICRNTVGRECEKPHNFTNIATSSPTARIEFFANLRQRPVLQAIEDCTIRLEVLGINNTESK